MTTLKFNLPFVWPSVTELTGQARNGPAVPFGDALEDMASILGIVSAVDHRGVSRLEALLLHSPNLNVLVILAVYAGCPTRSDALARLLRLQTRAASKVEFRIMPMTSGAGAPANCLVAIPPDIFASAFFFGPTPNFSINGADRTQVNMAFRADVALFDKWRRWFDGAWLHAVELTETTADIPALVPAAGSMDAAAKWDAYCTLCTESVQPGTDIAVDKDTGEVQSGKNLDGSEDPPPSRIITLPRLDGLADRVNRLLAAGKQVTIAHSSAVRPLDAPVDPRLFSQKAERRDGTVIQRQSFRISVFSKEELKKIEDYRKGSQTIAKKLGLPLEKGLYWMPDKVIPIFKDEIEAKNEEAKNALTDLVGGNAESFVAGKIDKLKEDLSNVYQRLGGKRDVPQRALHEVIDDLRLRIQRALDARLVTPVTFSDLRLVPPKPEEEGWQAPWAQAEKLVLALARFPREAIHRPKTLSGLQKSQWEILHAMDVEDDSILKLEMANRRLSERRAGSDLRMLKSIEDADIGGRDRCEAFFMLIDGGPSADLQRFISDKESAQ